MNQLRRSQEILNPAKAVSWCLHELATNVSIDSAFEAIVENLPQSLEANVCFIFENSIVNKSREVVSTSLKHWWKKDVEDKTIVDVHHIATIEAKAYPEIFEALQKREIFSIAKGLPLHPDLEQLLEICGLSSLLLAPIFKGEELWGLIGIGSEKDKSWESSSIAILQSLGAAIGIQLLSQELESKIATRETIFAESLRRLSNCTWEYNVEDKALRIFSDKDERATSTPFNVLQAIQEHVHPEDQGRLISSYVTLLQTKERLIAEETFRIREDENAAYQWVKVRLLILVKNNTPFIVTGDCNDVSENVTASLENTALQFQKEFLINKVNHAVFTITGNNWSSLNEVWTEMTGYAVDASIGKPVTDYVALEFVPDLEKKLVELSNKTNNEIDVVLKLIHQNGKRFWVRLMASNIIEGEKVTGIFGLIENIHERKIAQQSVLEKERRFRFITENISDCITIIHKQSDFIYVSAAASSVLGYAPKDLVNQSVLSFIHPEDEEKFIKYVIEPDSIDENRKPLRYRFKTGEEEYSWLETFARPIVSEQGNINAILCSTRNIDERVRLMKEMEQALSKEKTIYSLHQQLVTSAALDTKNKLTAIQASADVLKMYSVVLPEDEKQLFEKQFSKIHAELQQVHQTMNQLLLAGRNENSNAANSAYFKNLLVQPSL